MPMWMLIFPLPFSQTPFVLSLSKHRFFFDAAKKGRPFDKLRANGLCSRRLCETPAGALCQSRVGSHQVREEAFVRFAQLGQRHLMVAARQFEDDAVLDRAADRVDRHVGAAGRSEEHTSELQSLMRILYAVFCLKTK